MHGWLRPGEMLDGLGLAETTPGPLILVTEFVGYLAAYRSGGGSTVWYGVLGAAITLWATFAPCFLYIFVGAPYVEQLKNAPRLKSALSAITAAVVGVILNLTVWFALHVMFRQVTAYTAGPLHVPATATAASTGLPSRLRCWRRHCCCAPSRMMIVLAICGGLALAATALA